MNSLDVVSLLILFLLICIVLGIYLVLGWLPGHLAKKRHSPWAEAINVAGWLGILAPPLWVVALIWAFIRPRAGEGAAIVISEAEASELAAAISGISGRISSLENGMRSLVEGKGGAR